MSMIIHKTNLPDVDIDKSSFIYEDIYILIQDEYICDVLKCMNVPEIDADDFYIICGKYFKDYPDVLESYALETPHNAYYYARYALKGRFELGENIIATDAEYSFHYARGVLKGRFELGEKAIIAIHAMYSYGYAKHVLKGRFELGEKIIATNAEYGYYYAYDVLKGRFELGEHTILNSEYAKQYRERFLCQ